MSLNDLFITINHWLFFAKRHWESFVPAHPTISIVAIKAARLLWTFGLNFWHILSLWLLIRTRPPRLIDPGRCCQRGGSAPCGPRHRLGFRFYQLPVGQILNLSPAC